MESLGIIGYIAAAASTISLAPEVIKALRTHHLRDVSWGMLLLMLFASSLWSVYGFFLHDIPLIISGTVNVNMEITLIALKIHYAKKSRPLLSKKSTLTPSPQTEAVSDQN